MGATARLVVQMTPAEKRSLDERANRDGLSTSEFVRRRISEDGIEENRQEIESLLAVLEASSPTILRSLDEAIAQARSLKAAIAGRDEKYLE
jgi:uncharacterized protein (DUF1778 family)